MILGRHYTLDVLAGIAGGVALSARCYSSSDEAETPGLRLELFAGDQQPQRARLDS